MAGNNVELKIQNVNGGIYTPVPKNNIVQGIYYRGEEV